MKLPHRFPFRLVDRVAGGRAIARVSADSWWQRGAVGPPAVWLVEAVAQGAAMLLAPAGDGTEARLSLAAIERAELDRLPSPGDTLEIEVALEHRFGSLVRVRGEITIDGRRAGRATVVLAAG